MPLFGSTSTPCADCPTSDYQFIISDSLVNRTIENNEIVLFKDGVGINVSVNSGDTGLENVVLVSLNANTSDLLNWSSTSPSVGQVPIWNGSQWTPGTPSVSFNCGQLNTCEIGDLGNVDTTGTIFAGTGLAYNTSTSKYEQTAFGFNVRVASETAFMSVTGATYSPSILKFEAISGGGLVVDNDFTASTEEIVRYGINTSGAIEGQVLTYSESGIYWSTITGSGTGFQCGNLASCVINNLGNVSATPVDGQFLSWDANTSLWVAADAPSGTFEAITLSADSGTPGSINSAGTLEIVGGTGIDTSISSSTYTVTLNATASNLSDVDDSSRADGYILVYRTSSGNWEAEAPISITDTNLGNTNLSVGTGTTRNLTGAGTAVLNITGFADLTISVTDVLTLDATTEVSFGDTLLNNVLAIRFTDRTSPVDGLKWNIGEGGNANPQTDFNNDLSGQGRLDINSNSGSSTAHRLQIFADGHIGINQSYYLPNNISGAAAGYVLTLIDATSGETAWALGSGSGATTFAALTDTTFTGLANGDIVQYQSGTWVNVTPPQEVVDRFTGLSSGTTVTLSASPIAVKLVFRNGQELDNTDWSWSSGTTLTFTTAFSNDAGGNSERVTVVYYK